MDNDDNNIGRNHINHHHHHHHHHRYTQQQPNNSSSRRTKYPLLQPPHHVYSEDDTEDEDEEEEEYVNVENFKDTDDDEGDELEQDPEMYRRKRKWKSSDSGYEFAPRVPAAAAPSKQFEWTEHLTFVLLDVWGDRFLQRGRKSLPSEDWNQVAKKVTQTARMVRTDSQCRNRLDVLKKKYRKEKEKVVEENGGYASKWAYFWKMDMLMKKENVGGGGLACGLDSGEYVFMDSDVYLSCSNAFDEMRDSPGSSESLEGFPPRKVRGEEGSSFRLLADSIQKFGEIYEKIEEDKRQRMRELEKMRMEFYKDLEVQKRQIMEQAQAEIEKLQQRDDEDDDGDKTDASDENLSE